MPSSPLISGITREQSLINLKRDYIDLYYFHHGDFGPGDRYLPEAAATLDALVAEGKVRVKGQSAYSVHDFEKTVPVVRPQVLQSWANALDDGFIQPGSPVSQLLAKHNMSFVAFSPLAQGLLLDKFDPNKPPAFEEGDHRRGSDRFQTANLLALKPKLQTLKERFGSNVEDLAAMAINYILAQPHVACAIPGFRNERQVRCNLAGVGRAMTPADVEFISAQPCGSASLLCRPRWHRQRGWLDQSHQDGSFNRTIEGSHMKSRSTPISSGKVTSEESTIREEPPFPYLNEYHKRHSEAAMEAISKQPWISREEAYAQYDRLKEAAAKAGKSSGRPCTLLNEETS